LVTQSNTPRWPLDEEVEQPQDGLAAGAEVAGFGWASARRETTDSTTERRSSGSMVFIKLENLEMDEEEPLISLIY
jgi:hypothetical protein